MSALRVKNLITSLCLLSLGGLVGCQSARTAEMKGYAMNHEEAKAYVKEFYSMLNDPAAKDIDAIAGKILSPDWKSYSSETAFKQKDAFVQQVKGFGKILPDLKWDVKNVYVDGDTIIVRSEASGTPATVFFGVPHGGKSFKIMAIDIHKVKDGKSVEIHHVEDWAGALQQLK